MTHTGIFRKGHILHLLAGGDMGLPPLGGGAEGGALEDGGGVHRQAPPDRPPYDRGPAHLGGMPGGGEAAWEPSPPSMVGAGLRGGGVVEGSGGGGGSGMAVGLSHVA